MIRSLLMTTFSCAALALFSAPNAAEAAPSIRMVVKTARVSKVDFKQKSAKHCFESLKQSVAKAGNGAKLNFFFKCDKRMLERKVTLQMTNIPMEDAIRFICMASGLDYRIEQHAVVIFPNKKKKI
jgi:hypothetical protein